MMPVTDLFEWLSSVRLVAVWYYFTNIEAVYSPANLTKNCQKRKKILKIIFLNWIRDRAMRSLAIYFQKVSSSGRPESQLQRTDFRGSFKRASSATEMLVLKPTYERIRDSFPFAVFSIYFLRTFESYCYLFVSS